MLRDGVSVAALDGELVDEEQVLAAMAHGHETSDEVVRLSGPFKPTVAPAGRRLSRDPLGLLSPLRHAAGAVDRAGDLQSRCSRRNFATLQTLNVNLTQVCTIVIVAIGMTLVIATGGIDLSVGSLMAISGRAGADDLPWKDRADRQHLRRGSSRHGRLDSAPAACSALFNGWLVARFSIQPIVATLVLFIAGRGIAQVMTNGNLQTFRVPEFQWIGLARPLRHPGASHRHGGASSLLAAWLLKRTVFGRSVLAVGGNEKASELSGVPVGRIKLAVYAISGPLRRASPASSSSPSTLPATPISSVSAWSSTPSPRSPSAARCLTGGRATIVGTLLGALTIQLVRYTLLANGVPDAAALVVKAAIIAAAVWLQQQNRAG